MNTKQLMKWFYDNNIIIRQDSDIDRLKHLTFIAGCIFSLDEEINYQDGKFNIDVGYENYDFKDEELFLLNSINREFGFDEDDGSDIGIQVIKYELGNSFTKKYSQLHEYYLDMIDELKERNKDYNFNKRVIYNGENIYFLNFDDELTSSDLAELNKIRKGQKSFEVYKIDGELDLW